jgi:hypothetical protein
MWSSQGVQDIFSALSVALFVCELTFSQGFQDTFYALSATLF